MTDATARLQDTVHQRVRLGILAAVASGGRTAFTELADLLGQSNASLSQHLGVLEEAGFVELEKGYEGRRPRTWVSITDAGRTAIEQQMRTLRELMERFDEATGDRVLAAVYAMASMSADESKEDPVEQRVTPIGLAHLVLDGIGDGFVVNVDSPINRFYEWPFVKGAVNRFSGGFEANQRMFMELGLRSGWHRAWNGPGLNVSTQLLELGGTREALGFVDQMGKGEDAGIDDAKCYLRPAQGTGQQLTVWFASGELVANVNVTGEPDATVELGRELVLRWRALLADAVLEPA